MAKALKGLWAGQLNAPAPTKPKTSLVNVVDPIAEIRKLMDSVLFNPRIREIRTQLDVLEAELEPLMEKANEVRGRIRELYCASLPPEENTPTSLYDEEIAVEGRNRVIRTTAGAIFFIGSAGPFLGEEIPPTEEATKGDEK